LIEGILLSSDKRLRALIDQLIFIHADPDTRFIRRLQRDRSERGRTVESVIYQWEKFVKPMYSEFVEPSKRYASAVIPGDEGNKAAITMIIGYLESHQMSRTLRLDHETL
jgi:uridine kinase